MAGQDPLWEPLKQKTIPANETWTRWKPSDAYSSVRASWHEMAARWQLSEWLRKAQVRLTTKPMAELWYPAREWRKATQVSVWQCWAFLTPSLSPSTTGAKC